MPPLQQKVIPATPEPSPAVPITSKVEGFDFNVFDAEAAKKHVQLQADIEVIGREVTYGTFLGVPQELVERNYHFVHVGVRSDPAAVDRFQRFISNLGFMPAPKTVRCHGFEREGDQTLIVCCPPETQALRLAEKVRRGRVRRERLVKGKMAEIEQRLRSSLPSGADLHMAAKIGSTPMDGGSGLDRFEADLKAATRDMPKGRR